MNQLSIPFLLLIVFNTVVLDGYILRRLLRVFRSRVPAWIEGVTALALAGIAVWMLVEASLTHIYDYRLHMWLDFLYLSVSSAKGIWVAADLISRVPCLRGRAQWRAVTLGGLVAAVGWLCLLGYGAVYGRFDVEIRRVEVAVDQLPPAFDGYRIAQFSDLHLGTLGADTTYTASLVNLINGLDADLIAFTGDIVNIYPSELPPHTATLARLHAPDGVVAVMGNHDEMIYAMPWMPAEWHESQRQQLCQAERDMGWRVLLDENFILRRGCDSLVIAGTRFIGKPGDAKRPSFGSLGRTLAGVGPGAQVVLLDHDPTHWNDSIRLASFADLGGVNIPLTLAGHTHAMQFSVAGLSPAALRYKQWTGLHASPDSLRNLYVNPGVGTIGIPARVGARPEVTLITLRRR